MNRYLLDTHIVLWLAGKTNKLSKNVLETLINPDNTIYFSPVNLWEVAIKNRQNRHDFQVNIDKLHKLLLANDFTELSLTSKHVQQLVQLPLHHKDPFDRILIAQAVSEALCLISQDQIMTQYAVLELLQNE